MDFDPDWFREPALRKLATNKYTPYIAGSKTHRDWWVEQKNRCEEGYTVNGYRLTGDNYFWLNFYRLKTSTVDDKGKKKKASAGRNMSFPSFLVFQY